MTFETPLDLLEAADLTILRYKVHEIGKSTITEVLKHTVLDQATGTFHTKIVKPKTKPLRDRITAFNG